MDHPVRDLRIVPHPAREARLFRTRLSGLTMSRSPDGLTFGAHPRRS